MGSAPTNGQLVAETAQLFRLLGDETRLRIITFLLRDKELNVRTICSLVRQSQPAVSHHLALLREARLVDSRRDGKHNFYRLTTEELAPFLRRLFAAGAPADDAFVVGELALRLDARRGGGE